jgi:ketosteroid isomerase-like protein
MNANEKAKVLAQYQDALNKSDTDAVMKLYTSDGVFMPQNSPSSVGAGQVRRADDAVFKTIKLTVKFNVAEVVEMAPNWGICAH